MVMALWLQSVTFVDQQSYLHATYSDGSIGKWLVSPHSYRLQPQIHYHANYSGESICEKGF